MSLDHTLELDTKKSKEDLMKSLALVYGLNMGDRFDFGGEAISGAVGEVSKLGKEISQRSFGITPTMSVSFTLYPSEDFEEGQEIMARAVALLLTEDNNDTVFIFNGDKVILLRRNNHLIVNQEWNDESLLQALDFVGVNYEVNRIDTIAT